MPKPIVLLTDYGYRDPYAGILHGVIHNLSPKTKVMDLTHGCLPQNIVQAAYFLNSSYRFFPKGTIFVSIVDPGVGTSRKIVCLKTKDYCFLAPDNGLLTLVSIKEGGLLRAVTNSKLFLRPVSNTFHGRDIFAPVAARLSRSNIFTDLGPPLDDIVQLKGWRSRSSGKNITGQIVYFDHFGNAVSNIHKKDVRSSASGKIKVKCGRIFLGEINSCYNPQKKLTALWNSSGYLEIAKPLGSTAKQIKIGDTLKLIYEK